MFGLDDEAGTVIATWPDGAVKPAGPVPYAQETMHGMEYAFAQMLMRLRDGRRGRRRSPPAVRDRYDGAKRNSVERDRVRLELRALDGELGGDGHPCGLQLRCDARPYRLCAPHAARTAQFRSFWSGANAYGTVALSAGKVVLSVAGGAFAGETGPAAARGGAAAAYLNRHAVALSRSNT